MDGAGDAFVEALNARSGGRNDDEILVIAMKTHVCNTYPLGNWVIKSPAVKQIFLASST